jgi:hypothetical protein
VQQWLIGTASRAPQARATEGLSSFHDTLPTVPRLYAGGFLGTRSRFSGAVHGLRPRTTGSAPSWPICAGSLTTLQASLDAADWPVARPLPGTVFLRFDPGLSLDAGSAATGDPGVSPDRTRTGWLP